MVGSVVDILCANCSEPRMVMLGRRIDAQSPNALLGIRKLNEKSPRLLAATGAYEIVHGERCLGCHTLFSVAFSVLGSDQFFAF